MPLVAEAAVAVLLVAAIGWWSVRRRNRNRVPESTDRRRNYRVALATSVSVYGWIGDEPFSESAETLNVSAGGGLLPLSVNVSPSQELILTNLQTNQDLMCRVARSTKAEDGTILVGVDFVESSPDFWQIDFVSKARRSKTLTLGLRFSNLKLRAFPEHFAQSMVSAP